MATGSVGGWLRRWVVDLFLGEGEAGSAEKLDGASKSECGGVSSMTTGLGWGGFRSRRLKSNVRLEGGLVLRLVVAFNFGAFFWEWSWSGLECLVFFFEVLRCALTLVLRPLILLREALRVGGGVSIWQRRFVGLELISLPVRFGELPWVSSLPRP